MVTSKNKNEFGNLTFKIGSQNADGAKLLPGLKSCKGRVIFY